MYIQTTGGGGGGGGGDPRAPLPLYETLIRAGSKGLPSRDHTDTEQKKKGLILLFLT